MKRLLDKSLFQISEWRFKVVNALIIPIRKMVEKQNSCVSNVERCIRVQVMLQVSSVSKKDSYVYRYFAFTLCFTRFSKFFPFSSINSNESQNFSVFSKILLQLDMRSFLVIKYIELQALRDKTICRGLNCARTEASNVNLINTIPTKFEH